MSRYNPNSLTDIYNGLSDELIAQRFPAVFATEAHDSRSSRYAFLPTSNFLAGFRDAGFVPTQIVRQASRMEGQESHGKHFMRFRHVNDLHTSLPEVHEIGFLNSHNGSSGLRVMSGIIRFVCENGCIFGDFDSSLRVQHRGSGDMLEDLLNAVSQIAANSVHVMEEVAVMKEIMLSWDEQLMFSEACMIPRFDKVTVVEADPDPEGNPQYAVDRSLVPFQPVDFLRGRRSEDWTVGPDHQRSLYTTYQVVQENMITKPVTSRQRDTHGNRRSTRSIQGIDGNIKLNAALWTITKTMASQKGVNFQG